VQVGPNWQPVEASAAFSFFLFGITLLLIELGLRRAAFIAVVPALLCLLTESQNQFSVDLGIDELLALDHLHTGTGTPGRMALVVSFSLLIAAVPLISLGVRRSFRYRNLSLALAGSVMMSAGFSALIGHAFNLPAVYRWGGDTDIPQASAWMLLLLGSALLSLAWREHQKFRLGAPAWIPLPVAVASIALTLIVWIGLRERENIYLGTTTQVAINSLASSLNSEFERLATSSERLARRWGQSGEASREIWDVDARAFLDNAPACSAVVRLDPAFRSVWVFPSHGNEAKLGVDHGATAPRLKALELVRDRRTPTAISASMDQAERKPGFAVYAGIFTDNQLTGYASAEFPYGRVLDALERRVKFGTAFHVAVYLGNEKIYDNLRSDEPLAGPRLESIFNIQNRRFRIGMSPTPASLAAGRRYLPELSLTAGLGITLLLALSVHLARNARSGLHSARLSNQRLLSENDERRRIEEMLKLSDERLRLALDATHIGIFEWSLPSNQLYYSPGLWTMLGYKPGSISATPEAWTALIHPEDLPGYRAAIEEQLAGSTTFVEPEYRVRTATGEWRWLHFRAKTVTRTASGTPARIIGTLQDITPRKEAEQALRLSQAATRKLSLVASSTDNIVIIASASGTVEWVNESFERTLEYQLADVLGKNPADFMVGPDTNPRTLRRIQAALARGEGLTTDVVNYSKSGRKFHLHLEVQPARNDAGELENFIAVLADITSRVETEHTLRRAKSEADAASRAKSEFLASMSHEIRTPMNGVIGMTSLLLDTKLDHEQRDYVSTIRTSGEALLTIINDILDFSKIESGKMELERLPFELSVCIEDALDLLSVSAAAKRLELAYHIEDDVPSWIQGDLTRLRQVLVNLVNNAIKFTPAGSIAVTARRVPSPGVSAAIPDALTLEFSVADTGIGIPPDRMHRLFRPFSQVDSSTTRRFGGTGLGLAICHRLCTLMGGDIKVSSTVGSGSTFTFTIFTEAIPVPPGWGLTEMPARLNYGPVLCLDDHPVTRRRIQTFLQSWGARPNCVGSYAAASDALAEEIAPVAVILDHDFISREEARSLRTALVQSDVPILLMISAGQSSELLEPFTGRPATATTTKPLRTPSLVRGIRSLFGAMPESISPFTSHVAERLLAHDIPLDILLAEDNPVNQKVALRFLERLGYRADAVGNGLETLNALEARRYHLVLMDLQMPEMDGLEASRQIRSRLPADRQPKIIALTANALRGDRELCLDAGMDDYITKPVKLQEIADAIRRLFGPSSESLADPRSPPSLAVD